MKQASANRSSPRSKSFDRNSAEKPYPRKSAASTASPAAAASTAEGSTQKIKLVGELLGVTLGRAFAKQLGGDAGETRELRGFASAPPRITT